MRNRSLLFLLALGLVVACGTPPRPFTAAWEAPLHVRADTNAALPVTVYAFADARPGDDKRRVLRYDTTEDPAAVHATVPVGQGVARMFARGLTARGFRVTDMTTRDYAKPGASERVAIAGRVTEFDARIERRNILGSTRQHAGCRVTLEAYEAASGRRVFEKTYMRVAEGAMSVTEPLQFLARALADVVEQAVTDPDLIRAVRSVSG